jgi:hypothetical protein
MSLIAVSFGEAGAEDSMVKKGGRYAFCPADGSTVISGGDNATLISRVELSSSFVESVVARDECNKALDPDDSS